VLRAAFPDLADRDDPDVTAAAEPDSPEETGEISLEDG
jgi:hypothetical protein